MRKQHRKLPSSAALERELLRLRKAGSLPLAGLEQLSSQYYAAVMR